MSRLVSFVLLVIGIVLIAYGVRASESISSDISNLLTGSPTEKSIWLLTGGAVLSAVGAGGFFSRSRGV